MHRLCPHPALLLGVSHRLLDQRLLNQRLLDQRLFDQRLLSLPQVMNLVERILPEGHQSKPDEESALSSGSPVATRPHSAEVLTLGAAGLSQQTRRDLAVYTGRRLARLGSVIVTDVLRSAVLRTVQEYAKFWEQYAPPPPAAASDAAAQDGALSEAPQEAPTATAEGEAGAKEKRVQPPLFRVQVDVAEGSGELVRQCVRTACARLRK